MNCKNCANIVDGNFCTHCGQSTKVDKINFRNFLDELSDGVLQINNGLFYTSKELFLRPGQNIREYLIGKRKNHFKPIAYVLIMSTIYYLLSQLLESEIFANEFLRGFLDGGNKSIIEANQLALFNWIVNNYAYSILLLLPFYSFASYLAFLGSGFNYLEHFVLNSYITGQQAIFYSLYTIFSLITENEGYLGLITIGISISYAFWVFWQFFSKKSRVAVVLRSILAYAISFIFVFFVLLIIFLGVLSN